MEYKLSVLNPERFIKIPDEVRDMSYRMLASPMLFSQIFFKEITGRDFTMPNPIGRECHVKTMFRQLKRGYDGESTRIGINIAPGNWKSTICCLFIAWWLANYPDSAFIYASYSKDLAATHTKFIKQIIDCSAYNKFFGVCLSGDSYAGDHFATNFGGTVYAAGTTGTITGFNAGMPIPDRPNGALFIDDAIKPDEALSEGIRESVKSNFKTTLMMRKRSERTPIYVVGQRLAEDDLHGALYSGYDGYDWEKVILPSMDEYDNALNPIVISSESLKIMRETSRYEYWAQHQQQPTPLGGSLFQETDFPLLEKDPKILATFVTGDTAETNKSWNDASVFSFWGLYKIENKGIQTNSFALHWIDCLEIRVEPKHLEGAFYDFWSRCSRYKIPPKLAAIEKKSTGTTLLSILKDMRGIKVLDIDRTRASKSKSDRHIEMQSYIGTKLISLPAYGAHTQMVLRHMKAIAPNGSQKHDDICDTCYDAIKIALMDKIIQYIVVNDEDNETNNIAKDIGIKLSKIVKARRNRDASI